MAFAGKWKNFSRKYEREKEYGRERGVVIGKINMQNKGNSNICYRANITTTTATSKKLKIEEINAALCKLHRKCSN
jgi:hypothetical protein